MNNNRRMNTFRKTKENNITNIIQSLPSECNNIIANNSFVNSINESEDKTQKPIAEFNIPDAKDNRNTLVLDLDETLVHSGFQPISNPDALIPVIFDKVEIENENYYIYVKQRPGLIYFLNEMAKYFEIFIFTASISKVNLNSMLKS